MSKLNWVEGEVPCPRCGMEWPWRMETGYDGNGLGFRHHDTSECAIHLLFKVVTRLCERKEERERPVGPDEPVEFRGCPDPYGHLK